MKLKTVFILIIVLAIIAATVYFSFFYKPTPVEESNIDDKGKAITWDSDEFPLKLHSSGNRVKQLQAGLNIIKKSNLATDGKFGPLTLAALKEGFNVEILSEANYNTYILPHIEEINNEIAKAHPSNKATTEAKSDASKPATSYLGKSVSTVKQTTAYVAIKSNGIYTEDTSKPLNYAPGQYVGVVEADSNGWLRCMRANGSRLLILKNTVKI